MKSIRCNNYEIHFNKWTLLNEFIEVGDYSNLMLIVDENSRKYCLPIILQNLNHDFRIVEVKSSEKNKSLESSKRIWQQMIDHNADRNSLCINLGGGVIGDMGGFCASSFMRGVDFIQLPTTLLSMVDSSIGGKLGIDFNGFKNLVGLFKDPESVFIYPKFLKTLSKRELMSGMAEVYKYGLIHDSEFWNQLIKIKNVHTSDMTDLIFKSLEIKKDIVEKDPFEKGLRKVLNFGHTIGHALETANLNTKGHLLHGEAVALGMIGEMHISFQKEMLSQKKLDQVADFLFDQYEINGETMFESEIIFRLCLMDKKNRNQKILASLLSDIGECQINIEIQQSEIDLALDYLKSKLK